MIATWHAFVERMVFRHFFTILSVSGALAEWGLAWWLLAPIGLRAPAWLHVAAPAGLAVANRLAARRYEREPAAGLLVGRTGAVLVACAVAGLAGALAFGATAAVWAAAGALAARAEAGSAIFPGSQAWVSGGFRLAGTLALGLTWAAVAHGYLRGYRRLVVSERRLSLRGLSAPVRLVHVSDFHVGPLADRAAVRDVIDRVNALDADLVCVTGDLADSPATDLDAWVPELARLGARHGVFAILGNHDRHAGFERVAAAVARATTWRLLRDEATTVAIGTTRLHLAGLEDRPEPEAADGLPALLARVPDDGPLVLLAHHPCVFVAATAARVPLMLAGHTHGGQFGVPGVPRLNLARVLGLTFDVGLFERGASRLLVSRGIGTSGQRIRIGVPREIAVVTLVPEAI